ncbi:MAG: uncharacterized protein H6R26_1774, partial [Proteobacteria bacterium]|nr:uncharacterized protein [Pseudomonadota bacterium]
DQYQDNDAVGKGTYYKAFFCTIDSGKVPGLGVSDPNLLILKRNRSGAITGVYPLLEPTKPINMMGINNVVGGAAQCTETSAGSKSWLCRTDRTGDVTKQLPDMGVSDIDPQIFRGVNYNSTIDGSTTFSQPTTAAVAATLTVRNAGGVVQNTPVTKTLRDALQNAQKQSGALPSNCAVGDETETCMPSMSKALLTSLFAGRIGKWSDIKVEKADGTLLGDLTDFATTPPDNDLVHICRRNKGASTQAAINAYFLNTPCASTGTPPVEVSNPTFGPVVVAPTQVTATENCLDDFNDGSNVATFNPNGRKVWAISMLTTERNTALDKGYRYIKIDGYAPTVEQVAAGHYTYFSEAAYVWRKVAPKPTADQQVLIEKIASDATTPAVFGQLNAAITQPWGTGSFIAVSSQGYPVAHPFDPAQPVTPYTHAPAGTTVDNCRMPQVDGGANGKTPTL